MKNSRFFEREIALIQCEDYQNFVRFYFDNYVGDWFWKSGASSSGKYHPRFTQGEGGLVRHTRAVAMVVEELLRLNTYAYMTDERKDYARIAALLHDTRKYGSGNVEDKDCYAEHGALAAQAVAHAWVEVFGIPCPELLTMAIRSHMGQWVKDKEDRPFTNIDRLVHLADYIASRSFWDIPSITETYDEDADGIDLEPLPF